MKIRKVKTYPDVEVTKGIVVVFGRGFTVTVDINRQDGWVVAVNTDDTKPTRIIRK